MQDRIYWCIVGVFRLLFRLLGIRFDIRGADHIPRQAAAVVATNHIGYLDFAFIGFVARRQGRLVRFMAKKATFDNWLSGPFMRTMGHIPVDRQTGASAYRKAARSLRAGQVVGVFPEATISRAWTLKTFKAGAAALAIDVGAPLLPSVTWGGHRIATVDGHWSLRRRTPVTVLIGQPIDPAGHSLTSLNAELRLRTQELLDLAQGNYSCSPRNDSDRWWLPRHLGGTAPDPGTAKRLDAAALARILAR